jgi:chemotaxis protein methyltransferase CheR
MFDFFKKAKPMTQELQTQELQDYTSIDLVANYFKNETGVTFEHQMSILQNKVTTFCKLRDINSFQKLLRLTEESRELKQELTDYLTTNETFFYREFKQIAEVVELVKRKNEHTKILCAPSSTGEEPYSIAIALLEGGVSADKFSIVGIDINADALQKAQIASYKERNIRNLTPEILSKYFTQNQNQYTLNNSVKSLVSFKLANLFDPSFASLGKFDFIFSRNMLIYFDRETKLKAKEILESMRKDTGQDIFFGHADLF